MSQKIKGFIYLNEEHINTFASPRQSLHLTRKASYILWPMITIYSQNIPVGAKTILASSFLPALNKCMDFSYPHS